MSRLVLQTNVHQNFCHFGNSQIHNITWTREQHQGLHEMFRSRSQEGLE